MFDTQLLNSQPARYAVVGESAIPIVLLLLSSLGSQVGNSAGRRIVGRPSGWVFGAVWSLLAILMFFSLLIAAMNFDQTSLILFAVFCALVMIACVIWVLAFTKGYKVEAQQTLMCTSLFAFLALITSCYSSGLDQNAPIAVGLMSTPLPVWTVFAGMMGFLDLNR